MRGLVFGDPRDDGQYFSFGSGTRTVVPRSSWNDRTLDSAGRYGVG